jgi:pSer/pThr/pTyr-binding forkhead associated (FHA) protein
MSFLKKDKIYPFTLEGKGISYDFGDGQVLIGSSPKADVILDSKYINPYHATLTICDNSIFVTDLLSTNGTYINGLRVKGQVVLDKDLIKFADQEFKVISNLGKSTESVHLVTSEPTKILEGLNLPPLPDQVASSAETSPPLGLYFIDDEYCDIHFKEKVVSDAPLLDFFKFSNEKYIEEDSRNSLQIVDDGEFEQKNCIEIIFLSSGNIVSFDSIRYNKIKDFSKVASKELTSYIEFKNKKESLFSRQGDQVYIHCPLGFEFRGNGSEKLPFLEETVFLEKGTQQIILRRGFKDFKVKRIPYFWRDKEEFKRVASQFFILFLPFLLLTFISIPEAEKKKEVIVIFKKLKKQEVEVKEEKSSLASDSKESDSAKQELAKKISEKKSDISSKNKKQKESKSSNKAQKLKEVAKATKQSSKKVSKKQAPVVKFAASFSKMLGSSQLKSKNFKSDGESGSPSRGVAVEQGAGLTTVGGGSSVEGLGASTKYGKGKGYKSSGVGKSGFDSSFTSTKTVVLGAIDPDLLRRILREHIPQFRYCYQEELSRNSKIKGIIDLDFSITSNGKVGSTAVSSNYGKFSQKGISCITDVLKIIKFPKPKGGGIVEVKQPLNFSSDKTKV